MAMSEEEPESGIVEKADSISWGILEDAESGSCCVKVVMNFADEQRDVAVWIPDVETIQSLGQLCEEFARKVDDKEQAEQTLDAVLERVAPAASKALVMLQEYAADGVRYEEAVLRTCMSWRLTKRQAKAVLALMIASLKMMESESTAITEKKALKESEIVGYQ